MAKDLKLSVTILGNAIGIGIGIPGQYNYQEYPIIDNDYNKSVRYAIVRHADQVTKLLYNN